MELEELTLNNEYKIKEMSAMATEIVREHFDPLIGKEQNDYMIQKFQTVDAIKRQLKNRYRYYFVKNEGQVIGFLAIYPREEVMYLSKFYLYKDERGQGYSHQMLKFVIKKAKEIGLAAIELNVNRFNDACRAYDHLGFIVVRAEKNDIGNGFYMDDYVYRFEIGEKRFT